MDPNLERLIRLQQIDTASEEARRWIDEAPARASALDARVALRTEALATARERLADSQTVRRAVEKDLAAMQARLAKFRDQLMEVKTNKEYTAMQSEIATAEHEVRRLEDRLLELMLEGDERSAAVKAAEADLAGEQRAVAGERQALDEEQRRLETRIRALAEERAQLAAGTGAQALALFDYVAKGRRGVAVVPARDGHCSFCHVRLRPQVFNEVRRNAALIQCESCQRILYFSPAGASPPA
jgi:predicted  nucleic acid-binding Zn-ribbon protein